MIKSNCMVIGAGLLGRTLTLALVHQGHRVSLYEATGADIPNAAAPVAAAMLAPLAESAITELNVVRMGQYSLTRWPELLALLPQKVFFQREGTLIVWHPSDTSEAQRFTRLLEKNQTRLPSLPAPHHLTGSELSTLEPSLGGRFERGLYLPEEGQLDNRSLIKGLELAFEQFQTQGLLEVHWHCPQEPESLHAQLANSKIKSKVFLPHTPTWVIDCRGMGARKDWSQLRGVRGEVVRVHAPEVTLKRPTRLVHPRYPLYIAPKEHGLFVIGATEIESEDLSPSSVRSTLELLSAAYSVHPGFAEARVLEMNTQLRPTLPDNLPSLEIPKPYFLRINGLYRHGYLITPLLVDCALEWIQTQQSSLAQRVGLQLSVNP
jgi:glycine oxidase